MSASQDERPRQGRPPWPEETGVWATYPMHCHCGAVRWTMKISPPLLAEQAVGKGHYTAVECHCSHCERNGFIVVHPHKENVIFTQGESEIKEYLCSSKTSPNLFCSHCGSNIGIDLKGIEKMTGMARMAINVRLVVKMHSSRANQTLNSSECSRTYHSRSSLSSRTS